MNSTFLRYCVSGQQRVDVQPKLQSCLKQIEHQVKIFYFDIDHRFRHYLETVSDQNGIIIGNNISAPGDIHP